MLARFASGLLRQGAQAARGIASSAAALEEAAPAGVKEFTEAWVRVAPSTMNLPEFPSSFLPAEGARDAAADGDLFPVNFYTPNGVIAEGKIEQVVLPGVEGYFGVKANHVPIIAQLKPGLVELHEGNDVKKFFVSGGFAFVHPNSVTDICAVEAAPLDQFDGAAVKAALQHAQQGGGSGDDFDAAVNRAATEVFSALDAALDAK
ncbi:ATP synthase subunit delta mitochondrial [Raphidocelis subcapitata]|uniref:ATP synthase subunit delta mitochondrial n=1 Tax=Raphidocelis subcapitata TaxID=307507 RepID=A0A2V0PJU4_9CHLO|nr:ATP synthase subunit delta mitochondrial [Raphidocelis subcapitata]|eukprot:GBF99996.1 ATP synthase subunit delta mitochondrial [Raphidocelis subcapitata]